MGVKGVEGRFEGSGQPGVGRRPCYDRSGLFLTNSPYPNSLFTVSCWNEDAFPNATTATTTTTITASIPRINL